VAPASISLETLSNFWARVASASGPGVFSPGMSKKIPAQLFGSAAVG